MPNVELADAYVSIIPSAKGFSAKLGDAIGPDLEDAGRDGGDKASKSFSSTFEGGLGDLGGKIGGALTLGAAAAGAAAAGLALKGFETYLDDQLIETNFELEMGVSPEVAEQMGAATSAAYASGLGGSKGELAAAAAGINAAFGDNIAYDEKTLTPLIEQGHALSEVFGIDVNEGLTAAGAMLNDGLVADGQAGLDVLTKGLQGLAPAIREEVVSATDEFGKHFAALGVSGEEMMSVFRGADTAFDVNKMGDAMAELTKVGIDGSQGVTDAYTALGLNADETAAKLLAGGEVGREGLDQIVDALLKVEDPLEQARLGIALFGTPLEDLGTDQIPEFLTNLQNMDRGLGDVDGSAQKLADGLTGTPMAKFESFKRTALQGIADFIGTSVIPALEKFGDWLSVKMPPILDALSAWWAQNGPAITATATQLFNGISTGVQAVVAIVQQYWPQISATISEVMLTVKTIVEGLLSAIQVQWDRFSTVVTTLWNAFGDNILGTLDRIVGPMQQRISGALEMIRGIVQVFTSILQGDWSGAWEGIKSIVSGAWDVIVGTVSMGIELIKGAVGIAGEALGMAWGAIWGGIKDFVSDRIDDVVGFVTGIPGRLAESAGALTDSILAPFKAAFRAIALAWNNTVGKLSFSIPDFVPQLGGKSWSVPDIPLTFHTGGVVPGRPGQEVPALLQAGETVRTAEQEAALNSGARFQFGDIVLPPGTSADHALDILRHGNNASWLMGAA